jgi:hypothetical protein
MQLFPPWLERGYWKSNPEKSRALNFYVLVDETVSKS